ncbi:MAG: VacB/RNase II family 3'-5' exoribonuclease [Polyangiaceae bacterium]
MSKIVLPTRARVLEFLADQDHAVHAHEVATRLGVPESSYPGLLRLLDDLVFDGLLQARDGHKFRTASRGKARQKAGEEKRAEAKAAAPDVQARPARETGAQAAIERVRERRPGEKEGILTVNARGFGFVSAEGGDDVYIPGEALGAGLHGDRVVVKIVGRSARGVEGRIVEVVSRGMTRVVGTLRRRGKSAWLEPDDTRVRGPVVLTSDRDTAGAEGNSGTDGQAAVVRITRFPENPNENVEGVLEAVLGTPGELSVEAAKILAMAQIRELHEPAAVAEAESYGADVPEDMLAGREDLTGFPLPTIDPKDARDHDDAVWVERTPNGGYRAIVAIADVSSYVRPGMVLDEEAKLRGCSVYLPDRAVPMLPRALSSNLCSLLPDVLRLCLAVDATLSASGEVESFRVVRGYMKSQAKLAYEDVAQVLGFIEVETPPHPEAVRLLPGLEVAYELSRMLRGRRMKRGALDFELPEPKITIGEGGLPEAIAKRSQNPGIKKAYSLIEELMLLANEVVAQWLVEKKLPSVFRVHLPPDEKKLEKLAAMCALLGVDFDVEVTKDPKTLADLLKGFAKHPLAQVLNSLLLRSMKQATYDVENLGHFGLASKAYLHFTSPIRRYPDVCVHRTVHALLKHEKPERDRDKLADAALTSSQNERKAMEVERNIVDLYRAFYMKDKIGDRFVGRVAAVVGSGIFVSIDDPFVEILVKLEDLGGTDYEVDDVGLRVVGKRSGEVISLGDQMLVEVADVSIQRRTVLGRRVMGARAAREKLGKLGTELTTIVDDTGPRRRPRVKEGKPKKGSKNRVVGSRTPKSPKAKTFGKKKAKKR